MILYSVAQHFYLFTYFFSLTKLFEHYYQSKSKSIHFIPFFFSHRKYLAENIRLALFTPNKEQLIYSQKYFHFTMQTNEISLPGVEQLIENDVNNGKKLLNHRWKMITVTI